MATDISEPSEIRPGDIYEDSAYHPCLCIKVDGYSVSGISLVDGSYPRSEDLGPSGVRKLTVEEAWHWRRFGPTDPDVEISPKNCWWKRKKDLDSE
jgi:hypothetical protein